MLAYDGIFSQVIEQTECIDSLTAEVGSIKDAIYYYDSKTFVQCNL